MALPSEMVGLQNYVRGLAFYESFIIKACLKINFFSIAQRELYKRTNPFKCVQLFRERSSEKVYATIPNSIVGGF